MLATAHRLRRSSEFAEVIRGGGRAGRGTLVVHLAPAPKPASVDTAEQAVSTLAGFVVSKAVGGAVVRNAVRRRLRHLVRDRLAELQPGSRLVVRALPAAATAAPRQLAADLDAALAAAVRRNARSAGGHGQTGRAPLLTGETPGQS